MEAPNSFGDLGLSILGISAQYPPYGLKPQEVQTLAEKFYPQSAA